MYLKIRRLESIRKIHLSIQADCAFQDVLFGKENAPDGITVRQGRLGRAPLSGRRDDLALDLVDFTQDLVDFTQDCVDLALECGRPEREPRRFDLRLPVINPGPS